MEGGKVIIDLNIVVNQRTFGFGIRIVSYLRLASLLLSYMVVKFGVAPNIETPPTRKFLKLRNSENLLPKNPHHTVSDRPVYMFVMSRI
jgi:hypothetical protein